MTTNTITTTNTTMNTNTIVLTTSAVMAPVPVGDRSSGVVGTPCDCGTTA